jgi:hypothetical protein
MSPNSGLNKSLLTLWIAAYSIGNAVGKCLEQRPTRTVGIEPNKRFYRSFRLPEVVLELWIAFDEFVYDEGKIRYDVSRKQLF